MDYLKLFNRWESHDLFIQLLNIQIKLIMFLNSTESNVMKSILKDQIVRLKSLEGQLNSSNSNLSKRQYILSQQQRRYVNITQHQHYKLQQYQKAEKMRKQLIGQKQQQAKFIQNTLCLQKQQINLEMIELQKNCQNIRQLNNQRKILSQENKLQQQKLEILKINHQETFQTEHKIEKMVNKIRIQEKIITNLYQNKTAKLEILRQTVGTELVQLQNITADNQKAEKLYQILHFSQTSQKYNQQEQSHIIDLLSKQILQKKNQQQELVRSICHLQQVFKEKNFQLQLQTEEIQSLQSKAKLLQISQAKEIQTLMELSHESVKIKAQCSRIKQKNESLNSKLSKIVQLMRKMSELYEEKQYQFQKQIQYTKFNLENYENKEIDIFGK